MTRKHFQAIADALRANRPTNPQSPEHALWRAIVRDMTLTLARFNPGFDSGRFVAACEK